MTSDAGWLDATSSRCSSNPASSAPRIWPNISCPLPFLADVHVSVPCRYFQKGSCVAGDACAFAHAHQATAQGPATCRFFARGTCRFGDACVLKHSSEEPEIGSVLQAESFRTSPSTRSVDELAAATLSLNLEGHDRTFASMNSQQNDNLRSIDKFQSQTARPAKSSEPHNAAFVASPATPISNELCVFATMGKCRYGQYCRNVHGLQCPRCLRYCLHPTDLEQNETHIENCLDRPEPLSPAAQDAIACGICMERVLSKPDPRFGLLNCEHAFCLPCIRAWRNQHAAKNEIVRSCPLCKEVTYFIVPSSTWETDPAEKQKIIDNYKRKLG